MYEYTNKKYESLVNDFDDDYHKEEMSTASISRSVVGKLKNLKKLYRDFGEYCDAMTLINDYLDTLIDIYGGKRRLKLLIQLGLVKHYLPPIPVLKKTKKNRRYIVGKESRMFNDTYDATANIERIKPTIPVHKLDIDFGVSKKPDKYLHRALNQIDNPKYIAAELDVINQFYSEKQKAGKLGKFNKKRHKKMVKKLKKKTRSRHTGYVTIDDRIKKYYKYKDYGIDYDMGNEFVSYKGTAYRISEAEEIEVSETLRSLGINLGNRILSKGARKVIRAREKEISKSKKKNKKANAARKKYMKEFTKGHYQTFRHFENELRLFSKKGLI